MAPGKRGVHGVSLTRYRGGARGFPQRTKALFNWPLGDFRPYGFGGSPLRVRGMQDPRPSRPRRNTTFVEDYIDFPSPTPGVRDRFVDEGKWLEPLANAAQEDGDAVRLAVGPTWAWGPLAREVRVRILGRRERGDAVVITLSWEPVSHPSLFPILSGDLELAPIGGGISRLTLSASYEPPLGEVGEALDRAVLHRVAQSTVRSFLQRLVKTLGN
jgi:hypothetical protein